MAHLRVNLISSAILALLATTAQAACSDSEYAVYKQYDGFLEANPSVSDDQLRSMFARKVGMQPSALKNLYIRCTARWSEQSPSASRDYLKKSYSDFVNDCAKRPANDPYCKSGQAR
jgi:uncharacterized protein YneF (UPF0154 family)